MTDANSFPVPKELESQISVLLSDTTPYTLKNILAVALEAAKAGKALPEQRCNIAMRLWYLFLEYSAQGEDGDLYVLRYNRLVGDIEHQLHSIVFNEKIHEVADIDWTNLTSLVEDQLKILP